MRSRTAYREIKRLLTPRFPFHVSELELLIHAERFLQLAGSFSTVGQIVRYKFLICVLKNSKAR